jgi:3-methyl-2-oxobutanoate hydroxymethyltransferase
MGDRITAPTLRRMKERGERIVCLTAYDAIFARIVDESGVDVILVGDSVANVVYGHETTLPIDLETIVRHVQAVRRGVKRALLVADLPFGSYQVSETQAVTSAIALMKAGADAVKLEGLHPQAIAHTLRAGIPVMGHLGFTPQSVHVFGGARVQGRAESAETLLHQAKEVEAAGAFATVLELMPAETASRITSALAIPTIGIGAGPDCDGEIQVIADILGLGEKVHRHSKAFTELRGAVGTAVADYASSVRERRFPGPEQTF